MFKTERRLIHCASSVNVVVGEYAGDVCVLLANGGVGYRDQRKSLH